MFKVFLYFVGLFALVGVLGYLGLKNRNGGLGSIPGVGQHIAQPLPADLYPVKVAMVQGEGPQQGEPLLLEFWATWCPPCRQSVPHLNELYGKYRKQGLRLVGVTTDGPAELRQFQAKIPISYGIATDPGQKYARHFKVTGIPYAVLIDAEGKVRWQGHPMSLSNSQIESVLAKN